MLPASVCGNRRRYTVKQKNPVPGPCASRARGQGFVIVKAYAKGEYGIERDKRDSLPEAVSLGVMTLFCDVPKCSYLLFSLFAP